MTDDPEQLTPGGVLRTLAEVERAAETDDEQVFAEAVERFRRAFREQASARGFADWDELAQLVALEEKLLADEDLDVGYAAAAMTVREWITFHRHQAARLN
jgi:hypothetical protein